MLCNALAQDKVHATGDGLRLFQVAAGQKLPIVITMEEIPADRELFQKFRISRLADIGVAVIFLISGGVVVHCLLECCGNPHIVHHQSALLVLEDTVDAGDGLYQIVTGHRLVDIHGGQRWHIKARQPHIHHNSDFQRGGIVLEFSSQFLLTGLITNDFSPLFGVVIALGHDNRHFFRPCRV